YARTELGLYPICLAPRPSTSPIITSLPDDLPSRLPNQRMIPPHQPQPGAESRFNTAKATPPRINALATTSLADIRSERNTTPPKAARTGTRSCATDAWAVVRPLSALYQRTYPSPDVMTPDINASAMPSGAR